MTGRWKTAKGVTYDIVQTLPDRWLTTGQTYFSDSTLDEKRGKTNDFVIRENVCWGRELDALGGHAVEA